MMILHDLRATNFKKFREIELRELPRRGLIGIVGPNEGGKSSVVDAITFALFGRTPATEQAGLETLIHWEEEVCQVELVFGLPDGSTYRLFREIDRMGDHLAQLERLDPASPRAADLPRAMASLTVDASGRARSGESAGPASALRPGTMVSGTARVSRELARLLGYGYDDFRNTFFLAQHADDSITRSRGGRTGAPVGGGRAGGHDDAEGYGGALHPFDDEEAGEGGAAFLDDAFSRESHELEGLEVGGALGSGPAPPAQRGHQAAQRGRRRDAAHRRQATGGSRGGAVHAGRRRAMPDWSGVLFRITGIDRLNRAIDTADGVAASIRTELRQVEDELAVQGRVIAALGIEEGDEARLERELETLERERADAGRRRQVAGERLSRARDRIGRRAEAARELGGLALAMLRERVAHRVEGLARGLARRQEKLAGERQRVVAELEDARRRHQGTGALRQRLAELDLHLRERRIELDRLLDEGHEDSLVARREHLGRQARGLRGTGRGVVVMGVVLLVLAAAAGVVLALGMQAIPLTLPFGAEQLRLGAIAVAILGLVLLLVGMRQRSTGLERLTRHRRELEELDQRVTQLTGERGILGRDLLEIVRDPRTAHIEDDRIRELAELVGEEHRDFLDRQTTVEAHASELERVAGEIEVRLRHLDATGDRLRQLRQKADALAAELGPFRRSDPEPHDVDNVDLGTLEEGLVELKQRAADLMRRLGEDSRASTARLKTLRDILQPFGDAVVRRVADLEHRLVAPITVAATDGAGDGATDGAGDAATDGAEETGAAVGTGDAAEDVAAGAARGSEGGGDRDSKGPERGRGDTDRHIVAHIDAILAALPTEADLDDESRRAQSNGEAAERQLTELGTRVEERTAERRRLAPQFEKRRAAEDESQALLRKAGDLKVELMRELTAERLLRGTADQLRSRLAPALGRALGRRLGRITDDRYSRVSVDADFGIHVYSDERNGFIGPAELSGGTHDQLLLALRLAFAEVLLATHGNADGPHLLLLDEPLDSFDAGRARHLVNLLREGSGPLSQVFLLANQEHVADGCDLMIRTSVDEHELRVAGIRGAGTAMPLTHGTE